MAKVEKYTFDLGNGIEVDAKKLNDKLVKTQSEWNKLEQDRKGVKAEHQKVHGVLEVTYGKKSQKAKNDTWFTKTTKKNNETTCKVLYSSLAEIKCKDTKSEVIAAANSLLAGK